MRPLPLREHWPVGIATIYTNNALSGTELNRQVIAVVKQSWEYGTSRKGLRDYQPRVFTYPTRTRVKTMGTVFCYLQPIIRGREKYRTVIPLRLRGNNSGKFDWFIITWFNIAYVNRSRNSLFLHNRLILKVAQYCAQIYTKFSDKAKYPIKRAFSCFFKQLIQLPELAMEPMVSIYLNAKKRENYAFFIGLSLHLRLLQRFRSARHL